jgi:hypothetical protein
VAGSLAGFCKVCEVQELLPAFGIGYIYMWLVDGDNNAPVKWKPYSNRKKFLQEGNQYQRRRRRRYGCCCQARDYYYRFQRHPS